MVLRFNQGFAVTANDVGWTMVVVTTSRIIFGIEGLAAP